jgi:hypothetical protein
MPQPTSGDVHVNTPLTNVSTAFIQDKREFIADRMFPTVPVQHKSDVYFQYPKDAWFRTDARKRAPSTESAGSGYDLTTDSYVAEVRALHKDVDDQIRANQDPVINLDRDATEFVTQDLFLERELDWAANYFVTGVWTGSTTGTDVVPAVKWDAAASTPIEDMRAEILATKRNTGFRANKVAMGEEVWNVLQDHPDFLERIKYTQTAIVTEDLLARVLGIDEVNIAGAVENSASEGAVLSMDFIFGDSVLIVYATPRPSLMQPTGGYTFAWTGMFGANAAGVRIKRFRMEHLASDRVEGEAAYDHKVVAPEMGAFLTTVLT